MCEAYTMLASWHGKMKNFMTAVTVGLTSLKWMSRPRIFYIAFYLTQKINATGTRLIRYTINYSTDSPFIFAST